MLVDSGMRERMTFIKDFLFSSIPQGIPNDVTVLLLFEEIIFHSNGSEEKFLIRSQKMIKRSERTSREFVGVPTILGKEITFVSEFLLQFCPHQRILFWLRL